MKETPEVDGLADALVGAFVRMTAAEQRLVVKAYRLLAEAAPVDLGVLAESAGWPRGEVDARLASWPGVYLDGGGRLTGLWGLAVEAVSAHELRIGGHDPVWMWCALDPLFIVPLLRVNAEVSSTCPTTGEPIHLTVGGEGVEDVGPASTVVSFLLPGRPFDADIRRTFCHFVHFFASPAAADAWIAEHPGAFWIPLSEAAQVGRRLADDAFSALSA